MKFATLYCGKLRLAPRETRRDPVVIEPADIQRTNRLRRIEVMLDAWAIMAIIALAVAAEAVYLWVR